MCLTPKNDFDKVKCCFHACTHILINDWLFMASKNKLMVIEKKKQLSCISIVFYLFFKFFLMKQQCQHICISYHSRPVCCTVTLSKP